VRRAVRIISTGGTIAMAGERAVPALDAQALVAAVPALAAVERLEAESLRNLPGAHVTSADALAIALAAARAGDAGAGVVVTHGTDTLEETAFLCDVLYGAGPPIVFTGAIRPASASGADGPANLSDAVAVAQAPDAEGLGVVVVFAGQIHAARTVRKVDSTAPEAFGSPRSGPIGRVHEGRVAVELRPPRRPPVVPSRLDAFVPIVPTWQGDDGALLRAAIAAGARGVVLVALGAGHVGPAVLAELRAAAAALPVVVTTRPERGAVLRATYGFEGSEADVRGAGAIAAGELSPQAARMKLLACLGAERDLAGIREAFAPDDV
jgi:L-asparaginase